MAEIVACDDCSNDGTIDILNDYAKRFPDIEWKVLCNEKNMGFRDNFRQAISNCTGDYIFLCDQDDIWVSNKIERMVEVMINNPSIYALVSDFKSISSKNDFLQPDKQLENIWVSSAITNSENSLEKIKIYEALSRTMGQGCTTALTNECAEMYLKCHEDENHDYLIGVVAAFYGGLYFMKEQLTYYRLHENNTIGMAIGKCVDRNCCMKQKVHTFMAVWKYWYRKKNGSECRNEIFNKKGNLFVSIEELVGCASTEKQDLENWRTFEKKRLNTIINRQLVRYIILRIRHKEFFQLSAINASFEQQVRRLMLDLGAIMKK